MKKNKIIVRLEPHFWWGVYDFCKEPASIGLNLFFENDERIGLVSVHGKRYFSELFDHLIDSPEGKDVYIKLGEIFWDKIDKYIFGDIHYFWYEYQDKDDKSFYEVPYMAPKNDKGVKPSQVEIWHPDQRIGLSTIQSSVKFWAKEHLQIEDCEIEILNEMPKEESFELFKLDRMKNNKIIVQTEDSSFWWSICGFYEKSTYEDLKLFYGNNEKIGNVRIYGKCGLRAKIEHLKNCPEPKEYAAAIEKFIAEDKCRFWYRYLQKDDEAFLDTIYMAPKNDIGLKPWLAEIWHPDQRIGLSTIISSVKAWAKEHLQVEDCEIEFQPNMPLNELLELFKQEKRSEILRSISLNYIKAEPKFTDELITGLSKCLNEPKEDILKKLKSLSKKLEELKKNYNKDNTDSDDDLPF